MRKADAILVLVLGGLGTFIAVEALGVRRTTKPEPNATVTAQSNASVTASSGLAAPSRDVAWIRKHLTDLGQGTFVDEILVARDSNIARWPARRDSPVTVWIDERSPLAGSDLALASNVRRAFVDWGLAGVPLTFTFIGDSAHAEVHVNFVEHFNETVSGRTLWTRDQNWWIIGGNIQLALRNNNGYVLKNEELYAIALHEVGHLLGLDHTADTLAIMTPRVRVLSLSAKDVATMRLIYEVPPGSVKK